MNRLGGEQKILMQLLAGTLGGIQQGDIAVQADDAAIRQPLVLDVNPPLPRLANFAVVILAAVTNNGFAPRLPTARVGVLGGIDKLFRQALQGCPRL